MYVTAPNSAKPTMNPTALVTAKTGLKSRRVGRIGSAARRSTRGKSPKRIKPTAASSRIVGEPHASDVPPSEVARTIAVRAPPSTTVPR